MQAILLADRHPAALLPVLRGGCAALLPVLDKPLAVHAVEALVAAGVCEIVVAVSAGAAAVQRELGDGTRFGVRISYVPTRGDATARAVRRRCKALHDDVLVMRADVLHSDVLPTFLAELDAHPGVPARALVDGSPCGLERLVAGDDGCETSDMLEVPLHDAVALPVDTPIALHRANLAALAGEVRGLLVPGLELAPGLRARSHVHLPADAHEGGRAFLGEHVRIGDGARLRGDVVVMKGAVVDEGALLQRAVILPRSYVGPLLELDEALVSGSVLVRTDTGIVVDVADAALLADLGRSTLRPALGRVLSRLAGLLALAASLPLWPLMLVDAVRRAPGRPFVRCAVLGQRSTLDAEGRAVARPVTLVHSASSVPVLRRLPGLLAVARGDLALVGVRPLPPDGLANRREDWEQLRERAPVGLVGPGLLELPYDAPEDDRLLAEALYAASRTPSTDLHWAWRAVRALFSARAWRPRAVPTSYAGLLPEGVIEREGADASRPVSARSESPARKTASRA